jgi:hypothetical protein
MPILSITVVPSVVSITIVPVAVVAAVVRVVPVTTSIHPVPIVVVVVVEDRRWVTRWPVIARPPVVARLRVVAGLDRRIIAIPAAVIAIWRIVVDVGARHAASEGERADNESDVRRRDAIADRSHEHVSTGDLDRAPKRALLQLTQRARPG